MLKLFLQGNSQRTIWSPMEEKERKWHQNKTGEKSDFPFPAVLLMRKLNHILTKQIREMRQLQHLCEHQKNVTQAKDRYLNLRDSKGNIPENASQKLAAKEYLTTTHSQQLEKPPISNAGKRESENLPVLFPAVHRCGCCHQDMACPGTSCPLERFLCDFQAWETVSLLN